MYDIYMDNEKKKGEKIPINQWFCYRKNERRDLESLETVWRTIDDAN